MSFYVALLPANPANQVEREEDDLPDSVEPIEVADAACEALSEFGTRFTAGGFGDQHWRVDVYTDLAVIVPQLDKAVAKLEERQEAELAFYEQGVERNVMLRPEEAGDSLALECVSYGHWVPTAPDESASWSATLTMLRQFQADIAAEVRAAWPQMALLQPFANWLVR